jgi:hypothetical protein
MTRIISAQLLPGVAEWLARAGACPNGTIFGPSRQLKSERPSADPGEEVALSVFGEFIRFNLCDGSFIDHAGRNQAGGD